MISQQDKCLNLKALHQSTETWIIANPWDAGSARILEGLGFKGLATTSASFANTLGRVDGQITLEEKLAHCTQLVSVTNIPISADFENGFADDPREMSTNITRMIATGVAGFSIEDFAREGEVIYDFNHSVERIKAASEAIKSSGLSIQLTARAENLLRGVDDLDDTIKRLQAYSAAGADVLYAPGLSTLKQIETVVNAIDKPLNVLGVFLPNTQLAEYQALGVNRVSLGSALGNAVLGPLIKYGNEMLTDGGFSWYEEMADGTELSNLLS
jgi:2-methylisocitrate lyase-like PEP mutase family enzyme